MSVKLRERPLKDGRKSLTLFIHHNNVRWTEITGFYIVPDDARSNRESRLRAEELRLKRIKDLDQSSKAAKPNASKLSFVDFFEKKADGKNSSWAGMLKWLLAYDLSFIETTGRSLTFRDMTPDVIEDIRGYLLDHVAQSTARNYFMLLGAALNRAVKDRIISVSHHRDVPPIPEPEYDTTFLTPHELTKAITTAYPSYPEMKAAFIFSCLAGGPRPIDLRQFTGRNVEQHDGGRYYLVFQPQKTRRYIKQLRVKLNDEAMSLIGRHRVGSPEPLFTLKSQSTINSHLRSWMTDAGIHKHMTWKSSRHTFATLLLANNVDIYTIAKLLGHKSTRTTERYLRLIDEIRDAAVENLPTFGVDPTEFEIEIIKQPGVSNLLNEVAP